MTSTSPTVPVAKAPVRRADRVFRGLSFGSALVILAVLAGVALFLTAEGIPGITVSPDDSKWGQSFLAYAGPLVFGTLWAAFLALLIAAPVAIAVGLFISHYSSRKFAQPIGYVIDLLAAVPSVVYGLWGIFTLSPALVPVFEWLEDHAGFIPLFAGPASATGRTILTGALVLAIMVLPIMIAINREIFLQTPRLHEEAALALGATRWETVKMAVFPYARSGIVSSAMLALGRALGETMAIAMIVSASGNGRVTLNLISSDNPQTIAANIALAFNEATGINVNILIATGLVLFIITFIVNFAARAIVDRRKEFSGAN